MARGKEVKTELGDSLTDLKIKRLPWITRVIQGDLEKEVKLLLERRK